MEELFVYALLSVVGYDSGSYGECLNRLFLKNPENEELFALENMEHKKAVLHTLSVFESCHVDLKVFGRRLMSALKPIYEKNALDEFGKKMYRLWSLLPQTIANEEPFFTLCYADDCLSYGDEKQCRKLYEKALDYYCVKIKTDRLFLREMNSGDYEPLYAVLADSDIMKHYPYTLDEKRVRGWIDKNIERYGTFGFGLWAVCLKENGEMIGDCGLTMQTINGAVRAEIGYHIRKDHQRKGYAAEAAAAVRDWAFSNTLFDEIYSYMKADNVPSERTAVSYGCRMVDEYTDSENEVTKVYSITREEWQRIKH